MDRVPVLVVSGFLGSGKTSLVRWLLERAQARGVRLAVISNELGELGVDAAILGERAYAELAGGCVCCSLSNELVATLEMLRERVAPQRIAIETSGVALPWDTVLHFGREPVRQWIGDEMAVVVVNAEQLAEGRELEGTFEDQVSSADLLLLNQIDRVDPGRLLGIEARLRALEPEAPIVRCVRGRVPDEVFWGDRPLRATPRLGARPQAHAHDFAARELSVESGVDPDALAARLRALGALRAKGFARTSQGLRLVQVVGRRVELEPVAVEPPPALVGRLVVITRSG
jgi:cobalamin biosynthesis protein CobW